MSENPIVSEPTLLAADATERKKLQAQLQEASCRLQQAYADMTLLGDLSRDMLSARSVEKIVHRLFEAIEALLPDSKCVYLEWDALSEGFFCKVDAGIPREAQKALQHHRDSGYYEWAAQERRTMVIPAGLDGDDDSVTSMVVPLIGSVETLGIVEIFTDREIGDYTQRDLSLVATVANHAAAAMENAHLYAQRELKTETIARMKNYLANILQSIQTGMVVLDTEEKITIFNQAAERLFGIAADVAVGNYLRDLFQDPVLSAMEHICQEALRTHHDVEDEFILDKSTRALPIGAKSSLLKDENGSVLGVMLFFSDLTETKELINLRQVDKLKDRFIATVSHELRTPLTAIKSFAEILLSYNEPDVATQREFLTIIDSQSDRLTRLIDNIIDLSKIESGTANWNLQQVDVGDLVRHAVHSTDAMWTRKNLTVKLELADRLPPVWTDQARLLQAVMNVLDNAIKFTPVAGEITLSVEVTGTEKADDPRKLVKVSVRDTGPGIPAHHVERVFEKFHQVGDVLTDKPQGTGLGLAIAREIIHRLGGRIWAESKCGKGSTFHILLPVEKEHRLEPINGQAGPLEPSLPVRVI